MERLNLETDTMKREVIYCICRNILIHITKHKKVICFVLNCRLFYCNGTYVLYNTYMSPSPHVMADLNLCPGTSCLV